MAGVLAADDGAGDAHGRRSQRQWPDIAGHRALGYYDTQSRSLEMVYSLKSQQIGDGDHGDDMLFIATVCEDSLLRPYDRIDRLW
ncbi:hypothetical protein C2845_PM05G01470 [Panicum miliaceum]|uniref:Uncharacterized protein n=1 Tax=Panicum miliaceum TaxID=4540 RepID=A0A3L6SZM1_PANMI|nr:hypothetical protein C2845_PM05G01470 [Panicum miliaceum]